MPFNSKRMVSPKILPARAERRRMPLRPGFMSISFELSRMVPRRAKGRTNRASTCPRIVARSRLFYFFSLSLEFQPDHGGYIFQPQRPAFQNPEPIGAIHILLHESCAG